MVPFPCCFPLCSLRLCGGVSFLFPLLMQVFFVAWIPAFAGMTKEGAGMTSRGSRDGRREVHGLMCVSELVLWARAARPLNPVSGEGHGPESHGLNSAPSIFARGGMRSIPGQRRLAARRLTISPKNGRIRMRIPLFMGLEGEKWPKLPRLFTTSKAAIITASLISAVRSFWGKFVNF